MKKSSTVQDNSNLKVTVFWGDILYDTRLCKPHDVITVGRQPGNTFVLDLKDHHHPSLPLVTVNTDQTADLCFSDHVEGHLRTGTELLSLRNAIQAKRATLKEQGLYHLQLKGTEKADFVIGHVSFYLQWVKPVAALPREKFLNKKNLMVALAGLLFLGLVITAVMLYQPEEPEKAPERLITILPRTGGASQASVGTEKSADGGAAKGDVGKAELAPPKPEKPSVTTALKNANLGNLVSGLANLGNQAPEAANQAKESAAVAQVSTGGSSTEGLKAGGGGKTVGIGRSMGKGEGGFEGSGHLGLAGNSGIDGSGSGGEGAGAGSGGGLDRDLIESIIRRRLDRIRLCYDRQLNFNPKLAGKIAIHFIIGKKGEVLTSKISEDTMKNEAVKGCILREVNTWTFPKPEGGVLVNVDYPFVFESTNKGH